MKKVTIKRTYSEYRFKDMAISRLMEMVVKREKIKWFGAVEGESGIAYQMAWVKREGKEKSIVGVRQVTKDGVVDFYVRTIEDVLMWPARMVNGKFLSQLNKELINDTVEC